MDPARPPRLPSTRVLFGPRAAAALLVLLLVPGPTAAAAGAEPARLRGASLADALQALRARGLAVVFSSSLVLPAMRVESEPRGASPDDVLAEILAPHGLRAVRGAGGRWVVVRAHRPRPAPRASAEATAPAQSFDDSIVVTPLGPAATAPRRLDSALASAPNLDRDPLAALAAGSGATVPEGSSRVQLRGGRDDEVLILLDGVELVSPYHLQEFGSALSIVGGAPLAAAELRAGGAPAEAGEAQGGVLDLTTQPAAPRRSLSLGLALRRAEAVAAGPIGKEGAGWSASVRGGSYPLALPPSEVAVDPWFWDAFARVDLPRAAGGRWRASALLAHDELGREGGEPERGEYGSLWDSAYFSIAHDRLLAPRRSAESLLSGGRVERWRRASRAAPEIAYELEDRRSLTTLALREVARSESSTGAFGLDAGLELRRIESTVDYRDEREIGGPWAAIRTNPARGATAYRGRLASDRTALFATSRWRPRAGLTAEVGLRHDWDGLTVEDRVSPRLGLAWRPVSSTVVRAGWGLFHQGHRPNELQVEDGETALQRAERAELATLGLERDLGRAGTLRLEAYRRHADRPRARFENLFEHGALLPELEPDRVRWAPSRRSAEGLEAGWRSRGGRRLEGWLEASVGSAKETLDGREVPAAHDPPYALRAGAAWNSRGGWSASVAGELRAGWPTTGWLVRADGPDGSWVPVLDELRGERLPAYHRVDLRIGRAWTVGSGRISVDLELRNLYDRENVRGVGELRIEAGADGAPVVRSQPIRWPGLQPGFAVRWEL